MLAAGNGTVMIFQKTPDFSESDEILKLEVRNACELDAGSVVELMVGIQDGCNAGTSQCDRYAIYEQLQIVDPARSRSGNKETEIKIAALGYRRNRYRVL